MEKVLDKDKVMESINKLAERVGMLASENEEINERIKLLGYYMLTNEGLNPQTQKNINAILNKALYTTHLKSETMEAE